MLSTILTKYAADIYSYGSTSSLHEKTESLANESILTYDFLQIKNEVGLLQSKIRGVIIAESPAFQYHIDSLFIDLESTIDKFEEIRVQYPELAEDINALDSEIREMISFQNYLMETYTLEGSKAARQVIETQRGIALRNVIFSRIDEILTQSVENVEQLYERTQKDSQEALLIDKWAAILSSAVIFVSFIVMMASVVHQKALNVKLKESADREQEAYVTRDQFMTNMSHELRTPLNAIVGYSALMGKTNLSEKQLKFQKAISSSSNTLLGTINHFLDFKKMESGLTELKIGAFSLTDLMNDMVFIFEERCKAKKLELSTTVQRPIPPTFVGDVVRIREILVNLMGNALKFTENGGIKLNVACEENFHIGNKITVVFQIADTGCGMSMEQQERVFDRFYQVSEEDRTHTGTGLGLTITKQIVDLMNGELKIVSEVGKGTVFTVRLPLESVETADEGTLDNNPSLNWARGQKILVVDDNPLNLDLVLHMLEAFNFTIVTASNGQTALDVLSSESIDIVLLDIQIPDMDGYTVTSKIRQEMDLSIPIVALSAYSGSDEHAKALEVGMNDFIIKPFREDELINALTKFLNEKPFSIDMTYVRSISKGNVQFERKIIQDIVLQLADQLSTLEHLFSTDNLSEIRTTLHDMKPNIEMLGLDQELSIHTKVISKAIEKDAKVMDSFNQVKSRCHSVIEEWNKTAKSSDS